jgi:hypothetical protein
MVKSFGNQLLASAALADDEHWPVERRGAAGALDRVEEGQALANELLAPFHVITSRNLTDCWWQIPPFGKDFPAVFARKSGYLPEVGTFSGNGTALVS